MKKKTSLKPINIKELLKSELFKSAITVFLKLIALAIGASIAFNLYSIKKYYSTIDQEIHTNDDGIMMENSSDNAVYQNSDVHHDSYMANNYYSHLIDENTSESTLLQYAENAYNSGNYQEAVKIYSMDKLSGSTVAMTNLGYFYAKGLYFQQDTAMADKYYDKAIGKGSSQALENKIVMHLKYKYSDSFELLKSGYEANNENVREFLDYSLLNTYSDYTPEKAEKITSWILYEASDEEQEKFFDGLYEWVKDGVIYMDDRPNDTDFELYIKHDEWDWIDSKNDVSGTTCSYIKYVLKCAGIDLFNENIEQLNGV